LDKNERQSNIAQVTTQTVLQVPSSQLRAAGRKLALPQKSTCEGSRAEGENGGQETKLALHCNLHAHTTLDGSKPKVSRVEGDIRGKWGDGLRKIREDFGLRGRGKKKNESNGLSNVRGMCPGRRKGEGCLGDKKKKKLKTQPWTGKIRVESRHFWRSSCHSDTRGGKVFQKKSGRKIKAAGQGTKQPWIATI